MEMKMTENMFDLDAYIEYAQEIYESIYNDPNSPGYQDSDKAYKMMQERL